MDALELLRNDHNEVRNMFKQFRSAAESGDTKQMAELCHKIFTELETHTAIEEEVFYPAVRDAGGEALADTTDESVEEHHVVDLLIGEIRQLDPGDDAYKAKMTVLIENVEHHAKEEEDEMFPQFRELIGEERLQSLGSELEKAKRRHQFDGASKEELQQRASDLGIEGRSSMSKEELAQAVSQASE